jgi:hypothetical protein
VKIFKAAATASCLALLGAALTPIATADTYNEKTTVFKLVDSQSDRYIVQIFSADQKTVYATILAIPNYRLKVTGKTVITFRERPAGEAEALRAWFYPGKNRDEKFVYPRTLAIEIAKSTGTAVLFTPAELPVEVVEPIKPVDQVVVAQLRVAPVQAIQPTGEEVAV